MKVIQLKNANNSIIVNYLTDLIGDAQTFTVYQISHVTGGQEVLGLGTTATIFGFPDKLDSYTKATFQAFAEANTLDMNIYETGQSVLEVVYYGEAIGDL